MIGLTIDIIRINRACPLLWREDQVKKDRKQTLDKKQDIRTLLPLFPSQKEKTTFIVRPFPNNLHVSNLTLGLFLYL